jgi:ABC-type transporter Mla MlaB component
MGERFELPAELNIYSALETRDALLAWVTEQSAKGRDYLEVSAREVAELDGSGLQLLAALSNSEHAWRVVEPSQVFIDACRAIGLTQWLDSRDQKSA